MILPGSSTLTLILLILSLLCWGSWANTFKLAGKWRFELYYFDFAVGMLLASLIAAFTFGSLGWDGFSFLDDLRNAGKREDLYAFLGGAVFNLGNTFLLAAISVAGLSVAVPVSLGAALIVGVIWTWFMHPGGNPIFLSVGCLVAALAVVLTVIGYRSHAEFQRKPLLQAPTAKSKALKKLSATATFLLAIVGGLLLGSFAPLLDLARASENGLGPYSAGFIFAFAVVVTTFVYSLFFMNLPVQGQPLDLGDYFKGTGKQHGLGVLGGMLLSTGLVAGMVASRAEGAAHAGAAVTYGLEHGGAVLSALFGLLAFKEFVEADGRVRTFLFLALLMLAAGITVVALAPQFGSGN